MEREDIWGAIFSKLRITQEWSLSTFKESHYRRDMEEKVLKIFREEVCNFG